MADWPRAIKPEDRVKYLIQARQDLGDIFEDPHAPAAALDTGERVWVELARGPERVWMAMYASDHSPEQLIGEFGSIPEARKAIYDHLVLHKAVQQAWEDVAS